MPTARFHFEPIAHHHRFAGFRSDSTPIDTFLWKDALRETEEELSRTYLLIDTAAQDQEDTIAGFFTLRAEAQWTTGLPNEAE